MRIGCCGNMNAAGPDGTGVEIVEQLRQLGYDYIELPLAPMTALADDEFARVKERVAAAGLRCEACNNFFPTSLRLTGAERAMAPIYAYVEKALERAGSLGVKIIVFGSGPAKQVPPGFPLDQAREQLIELLRYIDQVAGRYGITIAIEPLRRAECNIVNTAAEGLALVKAVDRQSIKLLVDFYHMAEEREDPAIILTAGDWIRHVHIANPAGRTFTRDADEADYQPFFANLQRINYQGRVSVEAYSQDFYRDAADALRLLRQF